VILARLPHLSSSTALLTPSRRTVIEPTAEEQNIKEVWSAAEKLRLQEEEASVQAPAAPSSVGRRVQQAPRVETVVRRRLQQGGQALGNFTTTCNTSSIPPATIRPCCNQNQFAANDDGSNSVTLPFNISFFQPPTNR